ncbi:MAG: flagellar biosynthesis protein FliQ [Planctomycetes bacterium]|nr:flagellar biosynthesis protein FliQ [Planctomycetota bacterium]
MDTEVVVTLGKNAVLTVITLAAPLMAAGLVVGLIVGIFQTVTSIQESTLASIPKIIAVFVALIVCMPWMIRTLVGYTSFLFGNLQTFAQ